MISLATTDVIIMAGGRGQRLRSVIGNTPKCLAQIAGRPALFYHLSDLMARSAKRIILSLGYEATAVLQRVQDTDASDFQGQLLAVVEVGPTIGYAEALRQAYRATTTREVLILNADTFVPGGIDQVMEACRTSRLREPVAAVTARCEGVYAGVAAGWNYPGAAMGPLELASSAHAVPVPVESFLDYGTPENLERAEGYLREHGYIR